MEHLVELAIPKWRRLEDLGEDVEDPPTEQYAWREVCQNNAMALLLKAEAFVMYWLGPLLLQVSLRYPGCETTSDEHSRSFGGRAVPLKK